MNPNSVLPHSVVHIVDDDAAIRESLSALLGSVSIEARSYASAAEFLTAASPEMQGCVLLDVRMPAMSGLELQQELRARGIQLPVIIISGHGDVPMAVRAMKAGAVDFLLKPFNEQELLERIITVLHENVLTGLEANAEQEAAARFATLTPREREVLALIMACQHNKTIAAEMGISEKTVDVHRFNIMRKTGVRNLAELVQLRLRAGDAF
jgi:two-component system response regulator FixJ